MDDYDIYYVDSRNAVRDHRPGGRTSWIPGRPAMTPARPVYATPAPAVAQPAFAQPAFSSAQFFPSTYGNTPAYQTAPIWYPGMPVGGTVATMFGKLTTGQIVDMIAQVWGALQALPRPPSPTDDTETDLANLVTYQGALASHAKRDEQVRTLGSIVGRLLG